LPPGGFRVHWLKFPLVPFPKGAAVPELPDVEIFRQYLSATSLHQPIREVVECQKSLLRGLSLKSLEKRLVGKTFAGATRHGKYLFAEVEDEGFLVFHFGMTGFLRYFKGEGKEPRHVRLLLQFENGYRLAYDCQRKLGRIAFTETVEGFVRKKDLGPDAMKICHDMGGITKLLEGRRGAIKPLLMNQGTLAGIGNIYSDEILFQSGVHPKTPARALDDKSGKSIFVNMGEVLRTAIERRVGEKGWPGDWLLPHRKPGEVCPRCGGKIVRLKVSGRSAYLCEEHQRR
jgi:formamidopyrimidine-DNA glycosylase